MNPQLVTQAADATHQGTLPFPEVVGLLVEGGVESYYVDYARACTVYYDGGGSSVVVPLPYEGLPVIAADFNASALVENIRDSQEKGQSHQGFRLRAMLAGVQGYHAFLRGQRVTYHGRQGDAHTEWFPGAGK